MSEQRRQKGVRVGLISLGCAKNLVDAEVMLGNLLKSGLEITNDPRQADAIIVNTCSFIDAAQEESVDTILESAEVREAHNRGQGLIVAGCLSQRFRQELPRLLPEVDAFMGVDEVPRASEIVRQALQIRAQKLAANNIPSPTEKRGRIVAAHLAAVAGGNPTGAALAKPGTKTRVDVTPATLVQVHQRPTYVPDYATPRFRLTPKHFAYVKIAEGCNHPCSFCIIPRMRGSHRSRPQPDVVAEARALLAEGVKELNLISQDATYYGMDLRANHTRAIANPERFRAAARELGRGGTTISTLLRELNALPGDFWIRLLYTHPAHWTDELIETISACKKVARYVDIPLQHIHGNMLERMRRETTQEYILDLIRRIRAGLPGIALRTTFIVGFPGETEEYFQTLLDFIRQARFERLGVFTYSKEEGTRAAQMAGQIPEKVKAKRRDLAMAAQQEVAAAIGESQLGRTMKVLVEKEPSAAELHGARVHSWEHGLMRPSDSAAAPATGRYLIARGEADAPDIDGRIYIQGKLALGEFAWVKVIGRTEYDLIARPA